MTGDTATRRLPPTLIVGGAVFTALTGLASDRTGPTAEELWQVVNTRTSRHD